MGIEMHKLLLPVMICGVFTACDRGTKPPPVAAGPAPEVGAETTPAAASLPAQVTFNEHIQPILSEYCYHCHGPDSGTRLPKSEPLRLDRAAEALAVRASGQPVIVKGKPAESLFVKRLRSSDPDEIMPPPKSHKTLAPREIALLEQ